MTPVHKFFVKKEPPDDSPVTPVTSAVTEAERCHSGDNVPKEMKKLRFLIRVLQEKIKMERNDNRLCIEKLEEDLHETLNMKRDLEDTIKESKTALVDINDRYLELENAFNRYVTERNEMDIQIVDNIRGLADIIESNARKITINLRHLLCANHNKNIQELSNNENEINIVIFETAAYLTQTTENMKAYCRAIKEICSCSVSNGISDNKKERFKMIEAVSNLNNCNNSKMNINNNIQEIVGDNTIQEHESLKQIKETEQEILNDKNQQDYIKELNKRIKVLEDTGFKLSTTLRCTEMEKQSLSLRITELEDKNKKLEFMYSFKENEVINLKTKLENTCSMVGNQRKTIEDLYQLLNNQQGKLEDTCTLSLSLSQAEEKIIQLEEKLYLTEKILKEIKKNDEANSENTILNKCVEGKGNKQVLKISDLQKHKEQCKQMSTHLYTKKNEEIRETPDDIKSDLLTENLRKVSTLEAQLKKCQEEKDELAKFKIEAQKEIKTLHYKIAAAHGHQNLKQKIRYVCALKQENIHLMEQNTKLNAEITALKKKYSRS